MADFDPAFAVVIGHEGTTIYSNPKTGEYSKFGITSAFCSDLVDPGDTGMIADLTLEEAKEIYQKFWDKYPFALLADQAVASKVFDMAVNLGVVQAVKLLQRSYNSIGGPFPNLDEDGLLGPKTVRAANSIDPSLLVRTLCDQQRKFYRNLAVSKPEHVGDLAGWLKRAAWPETA